MEAICWLEAGVFGMSISTEKASPIVGNVSEMIPKLVQAFLLMKKVSVELVMYVIWFVENVRPCESDPDRLFAERILVVTGIRFDVDKFIFRSRFVPAR